MYDVFISHKSNNVDIAKGIKTFLQHNNINSFIDIDDYSREASVLDKVVAGMENSKLTLFIITEDFLSDPRWVATEFGMSIIAKNKPIYCTCGISMEQIETFFSPLKGKNFDKIDDLKEVFISFYTKTERAISNEENNKLLRMLKTINTNLDSVFETTVNWRLIFSLFERHPYIGPILREQIDSYLKLWKIDEHKLNYFKAIEIISYIIKELSITELKDTDLYQKLLKHLNVELNLVSSPCEITNMKIKDIDELLSKFSLYYFKSLRRSNGNFKIITKSDFGDDMLKQSIKIEEKIFLKNEITPKEKEERKEMISDFSTVQRWQEHNNQIYTGVLNKENELLGFSTIIPLCSSLTLADFSKKNEATLDESLIECYDNNFDKTINLYISSVCVDPKISTRGQILRLLYEELIFLMFDLSLHKKIKIGKIFGEDSNVDDCTRIHQNFDLLNSKYDKYKKKIKSKNGVLFEINLDKLECEMDLLYNFLIK